MDEPIKKYNRLIYIWFGIILYTLPVFFSYYYAKEYSYHKIAGEDYKNYWIIYGIVVYTIFVHSSLYFICFSIININSGYPKLKFFILPVILMFLSIYLPYNSGYKYGEELRIYNECTLGDNPSSVCVERCGFYGVNKGEFDRRNYPDGPTYDSRWCDKITSDVSKNMCNDNTIPEKDKAVYCCNACKKDFSFQDPEGKYCLGTEYYYPHDVLCSGKIRTELY